MKSARSIDRAEVLRSGIRVGTIARTPHGAVFEYAASFFTAHQGNEGGIAIHLPYARQRAETLGANLHPFFAGLLPEGLRLNALVSRVKTSADDLLSLLIASGADTVGDLSVVPAGLTSVDTTPQVDIRRLAEASFAELFEQSLAGTGNGREPTVPGVQEKISASMISFPLQAAREKRTYILKLNPPRVPRLVENENFFMKAAKDCGLDVATTTLVHDRTGAAGLLVERFDRIWSTEAKHLTRIHQEDACQFLNRYPADKYRLSCAEIADGLSVCAAPILESARLIRLLAFAYLIANGDLHGKNVSVLASGPGGSLRLAPAYDLLSTLPYGDQRMALKLEGRDDNLRRAHFVSFGTRLGVQPAAVKAILDELCARLGSWSERLDEIGLDARKSAHLARTMEKHRKELG